MSTPVTDEDYRLVFEDLPGGSKILEDLVARFGNNPFVQGGHEADRQTAFNAGRLSVVNYILARVNRESEN